LFPENEPPFVTLLNVVPPFVEICHWNVGVGVPLSATVNVAVPLAVTVTLPGCVVNDGGTVKVAFVLVVAPPVFVATTRTIHPFSVAFTASAVNTNPVFPENAGLVMFANVVPPFVDNCHANVAAGVALTATVNVALFPEIVVLLAGCVVNNGGTNSVALLLVVVPVALNASTRTSHPFSVVFTASADNVFVLFPVNAALFVMFANVVPAFVDNCHANDGVAVDTVTLNVALDPEIVVLLTGCTEITGDCPHALPHPASAIRPSAASRRQPRPPALIIPLHKDVLSFIMG
jgi:hypothetical protein